jgi:urease accessory protein
MSEPAVQAGWCARLELRFQSLRGRTRVTHRRHIGPLLVQRAFYPESDTAGGAAPEVGGAAHAGRDSGAPRVIIGDTTVAGSADTPQSVGGAVHAGASRSTRASPPLASEPCHLYIIHPPGGVAGGDDLELEADVGPGAHALLTTPAAGKFYRRGTAGTARLAQAWRVDDGLLEWLPQENIFYPDSAVEISSIVRLSAGARFLGWEISCLGLPARGQPLQSGELRQCFELWRDDHPLLLERLTIERACLTARWGMAGHTSLGTWIGYPAGASELEIARVSTAAYCPDMTVACTLVDGVLICRARAMRADQLKQVFIGLWRAVRPALMGREAVTPRIWAT